jgi:preprotein translocase subunit Sec61beta
MISSFWRSIRMVSWSFFGIRKNSESQEDTARVNPVHIVVVGIAGAVIFVVALIVLVNWVVAK